MRGVQNPYVGNLYMGGHLQKIQVKKYKLQLTSGGD